MNAAIAFFVKPSICSGVIPAKADDFNLPNCVADIAAIAETSRFFIWSAVNDTMTDAPRLFICSGVMPAIAVGAIAANCEGEKLANDFGSMLPN